MVWDCLLDSGRLEWQRTLQDLERAPNIAYQDMLKEFDYVWCVKGLIVTLSDTWKVRPRWELFLESPWVKLVTLGGCTFPLRLNVSICS